MSTHFDGARFRNVPATEHAGFKGLLKWRFGGERRPGRWRAYEELPPGPPPPRRVGRGELRVTFVNHSTVLIQTDGLNILTDPMWSERASPVAWAGPRRARPPGIRFEDLPPIDFVLLSHNHYDHLDLPTLRRLAATHRPRVISGLGNAALLASKGLDGAVDIDWWQGFSLADGVSVHAVPAQHFSARGMCDRNRSLWSGFVITSRAGRTYFAGDTGFGPHFAAVGERFGPLRLALLPIGAFRPRWFMHPMHISPEEAIEAARKLRAATAMAIHFGTFPLGDDGQDEPAQVLRAALARLPAARRPRFWVLDFGEGRDVPAPAAAAPIIERPPSASR